MELSVSRNLYIMYPTVCINVEYLCFLLEGNYRDMFCCYFETFAIVTWQHATKFLAKEKREEYQVSLTSFFFKCHGKLRREL